MTRWGLGVVLLLVPISCGPSVVTPDDDMDVTAQAGTPTAGNAAHQGGDGTGGSAVEALGGGGADAAGTGPEDCPIVGYVRDGDECIWMNPIRSPGFETAEDWNPSGSAEVDTSGEWGEFSQEALCFGGALSQQVTMPAASETVPMALSVRARRSTSGGDIPRLGVVMNGRLHAIEVGFDTRWIDSSFCLGEGDYGGPLTISFQRYDTLSGCMYEPVHIDDVSIEPAAEGACPSPLTVLDGNFDMGSPQWSSTGAVSFTGGAAVLEGTSCEPASAAGKASIPEEVDAPLAALAITYSLSTEGTTEDATLNVNLEGFRVGTLPPRATLGTAYVCVPKWARGGIHAVELAVEDPFGGLCSNTFTATIESVEVVEDESCTALSPVDGGFEGLGSASGSSWSHLLSGEGLVPRVVENPQDSHSGSNYLALDIRYPCTWAGAVAVGTTPEPITVGTEEGPALSFWYRLPTSGQGNLMVCTGPGETCTPLDVSEQWQQTSVCIDPTLGGLPVKISLAAEGGDGSCAASYPEQTAWFDDLALTTDPSCPVN